MTSQLFGIELPGDRAVTVRVFVNSHEPFCVEGDQAPPVTATEREYLAKVAAALEQIRFRPMIENATITLTMGRDRRTVSDAIRAFTIRIVESDPTPDGGVIIRRAVLLVEGGVEFEITDKDPPFLRVREALDDSGCPHLELLGRADDREPWRVLQRRPLLM